MFSITGYKAPGVVGLAGISLAPVVAAFKDLEKGVGAKEIVPSLLAPRESSKWTEWI